ncbi:hypothetical protein B0H16DRAFT_1797188 [Mycena metata]|uniref:Uncharacterized protein n=1 Tax=Mycena metata TaxID=1033252 RepID=A0AAD7MI74_9AGAR|nr:hypothetical protein B0H16DRAFT_1797188 [Mycena metata]
MHMGGGENMGALLGRAEVNRPGQNISTQESTVQETYGAGTCGGRLVAEMTARAQCTSVARQTFLAQEICDNVSTSLVDVRLYQAAANNSVVDDAPLNLRSIELLAGKKDLRGGILRRVDAEKRAQTRRYTLEKADLCDSCNLIQSGESRWDRVEGSYPVGRRRGGARRVHREETAQREMVVVGSKECFKLRRPRGNYVFRAARGRTFQFSTFRLVAIFVNQRNLVGVRIEQKMAVFGKEEADLGRFGHNRA